ncbi:MAG TPA: RNA degradosome polyphosphate kinase, partial [Polyangiaceae bacterium]|nr:RNA degradosome polyphosphate kinase [Polyangiaceae bacterium]
MLHEATAPLTAASSPEAFINRELSWLAFNARVLDQACDTRWPLLERVKFLAIFGSNLDEFFMIRVAGLHEQLESGVGVDAADGMSVREQLAKIRSVVTEQIRLAEHVLQTDLLAALAREGVRLLRWKELSADAQRWAREHFFKHVFPVLTPLAVDPAHPFPFLSNLSLSLAVEALDPVTGDHHFARVKVPSSLPRFVRVPAAGETDVEESSFVFVTLEEVIGGCLDRLFPGMKVLGSYALRVTRDMDLDLEEEASDLLAQVDREIRERRFGAAVRLELVAGVPR